jgi:hypothetical protein
VDNESAVLAVATDIVRGENLAVMVEREIAAQLDPAVAAQLGPIIDMMLDHLAALETRVDVLEQLANQNGWGAWWR